MKLRSQLAQRPFPTDRFHRHLGFELRGWLHLREQGFGLSTDGAEDLFLIDSEGAGVSVMRVAFKVGKAKTPVLAASSATIPA